MHISSNEPFAGHSGQGQQDLMNHLTRNKKAVLSVVVRARPPAGRGSCLDPFR
jgi:hypothetical protein